MQSFLLRLKLAAVVHPFLVKDNVLVIRQRNARLFLPPVRLSYGLGDQLSGAFYFFALVVRFIYQLTSTLFV